MIQSKQQNKDKQRDILYYFITWYNAKPKVKKGKMIYTTDVDKFLNG